MTLVYDHQHWRDAPSRHGCASPPPRSPPVDGLVPGQRRRSRTCGGRAGVGASCRRGAALCCAATVTSLRPAAGLSGSSWILLAFVVLVSGFTCSDAQSTVSRTSRQHHTSAPSSSSVASVDSERPPADRMAADISPAMLVSILALLSLLLVLCIIAVHKYKSSRQHGGGKPNVSDRSPRTEAKDEAVGNVVSRRDSQQREDGPERRGSMSLRRQSSLPFGKPAGGELTRCFDTPSTSFSSYLHLKSADSDLGTDHDVNGLAGDLMGTSLDMRRLQSSVAAENPLFSSLPVAGFLGSEVPWQAYSVTNPDHRHHEPGVVPHHRHGTRHTRMTSSVTSHPSLHATSSLGSEASRRVGDGHHRDDDDDDVFSTCSKSSNRILQLVTFPQCSDDDDDDGDDNATRAVHTPPGALLRSRLSSASPSLAADRSSTRTLHGETHRTRSGGDHLHGSHNPVLFRRSESCQSLVDRTVSGESQRSAMQQQQPLPPRMTSSHSHTASFPCVHHSSTADLAPSSHAPPTNNVTDSAEQPRPSSGQTDGPARMTAEASDAAVLPARGQHQTELDVTVPPGTRSHTSKSILTAPAKSRQLAVQQDSSRPPITAFTRQNTGLDRMPRTTGGELACQEPGAEDQLTMAQALPQNNPDTHTLPGKAPKSSSLPYLVDAELQWCATSERNGTPQATRRPDTGHCQAATVSDQTASVASASQSAAHCSSNDVGEADAQLQQRRTEREGKHTDLSSSSSEHCEVKRADASLVIAAPYPSDEATTSADSTPSSSFSSDSDGGHSAFMESLYLWQEATARGLMPLSMVQVQHDVPFSPAMHLQGSSQWQAPLGAGPYHAAAGLQGNGALLPRTSPGTAPCSAHPDSPSVGAKKRMKTRPSETNDAVSSGVELDYRYHNSYPQASEKFTSRHTAFEPLSSQEYTGAPFARVRSDQRHGNPAPHCNLPPHSAIPAPFADSRKRHSYDYVLDQHIPREPKFKVAVDSVGEFPCDITSMQEADMTPAASFGSQLNIDSRYYHNFSSFQPRKAWLHDHDQHQHLHQQHHHYQPQQQQEQQRQQRQQRQHAEQGFLHDYPAPPVHAGPQLGESVEVLPLTRVNVAASATTQASGGVQQVYGRYRRLEPEVKKAARQVSSTSIASQSGSDATAGTGSTLTDTCFYGYERDAAL